MMTSELDLLKIIIEYFIFELRKDGEDKELLMTYRDCLFEYQNYCLGKK